eukprot:GHVP01060764.1.p1 GENE.GHVP01060764.1~~GHVP01060764.1.p1  ORF type:complete len:500 (-),score=111.61 GHVP01060764.1:2785-4284(-)
MDSQMEILGAKCPNCCNYLTDDILEGQICEGCGYTQSNINVVDITTEFSAPSSSKSSTRRTFSEELTVTKVVFLEKIGQILTQWKLEEYRNEVETLIRKAFYSLPKCPKVSAYCELFAAAGAFMASRQHEGRTPLSIRELGILAGKSGGVVGRVIALLAEKTGMDMPVVENEVLADCYIDRLLRYYFPPDFESSQEANEVLEKEINPRNIDGKNLELLTQIEDFLSVASQPSSSRTSVFEEIEVEKNVALDSIFDDNEKSIFGESKDPNLDENWSVEFSIDDFLAPDPSKPEVKEEKKVEAQSPRTRHANQIRKPTVKEKLELRRRSLVLWDVVICYELKAQPSQKKRRTEKADPASNILNSDYRLYTKSTASETTLAAVMSIAADSMGFGCLGGYYTAEILKIPPTTFFNKLTKVWKILNDILFNLGIITSKKISPLKRMGIFRGKILFESEKKLCRFVENMKSKEDDKRFNKKKPKRGRQSSKAGEADVVFIGHPIE